MGGPGTNVDGKIDLHSHSIASDGELEPAEVAERAKVAGVSVWALSDHDTLAGLPEAADAAKRRGIRFVPGIELSAFLGAKEIHVLGHFLDPDHPSLRQFEDDLAVHRRRRMEQIVEKLGSLNVKVRVGDIEKWSGGKTIGRPHVARAIVATSSGCLLVIDQAIALPWPADATRATTMIALDIFAAALVIAMLGAMLNEDTRDHRVRIAR